MRLTRYWTSTLIVLAMATLGYTLLRHAGSRSDELVAAKAASEVEQRQTNRKGAAIVGQPEQDRPSANDVVTAAAMLPPDFQADVLLRIAGSDSASTTGRSNESDGSVIRLSEQAYALSQQAARSMPGLATVGYVREEDDDELRSARTMGLDQFSLQIRAISLMERHSPGRALALIPALPKPVAADCDSAYVDDPTAVYALLPTIGIHDTLQNTDLLLAQIDRANSEADIAPALKSVIRLPPGSATTEAGVAQHLAKLLLRARGDDVSFTATELSVASDIQLALQRVESIPGVHAQLRASYRDYVQAHLSAARCTSSLAGNHQLLEQRFVAELPVDRIREPAPLTPSRTPEAETAVSLVRQAGYNVRTELLGYVGQEPLHAAALSIASKEFLDQIDSGPLREAATSDATGRIRRAQLMEILRYLEYAPAGTQRDHGFAILDGLLDGPHYRRDHDMWLGDLKRVADQAARWPDRRLRLRHMSASTVPVLRVYAMLMQRQQFS
ncbi:hypothetical protein [Xanthomonas arboricola]|uniref:hypothetical protein n=1 Tax=Xanthomonas arboricola TaxID=56448 RepID=UPI001EE7452A|nr:hypothetical protein [Xanthomonas arboricola]